MTRLSSSLYRFMVGSVLAVVVLAGCQPKEKDPGPGELILSIRHRALGDSLRLGREYAFGVDAVTIERLRYYLSRPELLDLAGRPVATYPDNYHLISPTDRSTVQIRMSVPRGIRPASLRLNFGVDSARNLSTAQVGDLDPTNGMAWDWETGYKFLLLEGNYRSGQGSGGLVWHVGTASNYRTLTLPLNIDRPFGARNTIHLFADLDGLIIGASDMRPLSQNSTIMMDPTKTARVAQNVASSFLGIDRVTIQ